MVDEEECIIFLRLGCEDHRIVSMLDLLPFFYLIQITDMKINSKTVISLVNCYDILRQFFETEHSSVLLPIKLEAPVWKHLNEITQFSILSKLFHIVKALPAKNLSQLIDSLFISKDLHHVWLQPLLQPEELSQHNLIAELALFYGLIDFFHVDHHWTAGRVSSIFYQLLDPFAVLADDSDHERGET